MKAVCVALWLFLMFIGVTAQETVNPSNNSSVEVIQKEWYMEVNNPAFDKSPFSPIEEMQQMSQVRRATQRQNQIRARRGLPPLRNPVTIPQPDAEGKSPNVYTYKAKFKNNGEKEIKTLVWEYVVFEPGTEREVGRLQFVSEVKIASGKTKSLAISCLSPPSDTINVKDTSKKLRDQYTDKVVIHSIEYSDGTFWESATTGAELPK